MKKRSIAVLYIVYMLFMVSGCVKPDISSNENDGHSLTRALSEKKYWYTFDEKRYLNEVPNKVVLGLDEKYLSEIRFYLQKHDQIRGMELNHREGRFCMYILTTTENANISTLMEDLKKLSGVKSVNPSYILADYISPEISILDEIIMRFKDHVSQQEINEIHKKYPVEIKEVTPYWQILSVPVSADILGIANAYQESGLVIYSQPNFLSKVELCQTLPTDPYFSYQYYLRNTGQQILNGPGNYYVTGTPGADINISNAWNITKGSSNITIAVLDQGVTSNHPDLPNTRQVRLPGSNFTTTPHGNDPSPVGDEAHGVSCAGIIAASHNNEGIAGIAPNCKIMPVKIPFGIVTQTMLEEIASAIRFAMNNGADIISNSWDIPSRDPNYSSVIVNAIRDATTQGRNWKGCVVVFAAGNTANHPRSNGYIKFPANVDIPGVLTVGASDRDDFQALYSPISVLNDPDNQIIDVVAPSRKAYSWQIWQTPLETHDVWTMDIPGSSGYNPVKTTDDAQGYIGTRPAVGTYLPGSGTNYDAYTGHFGGTSAACPQVAGVAALILSVAPDISQNRVAFIINSTARKANSGFYTYQTTPGRPDGTWNDRMGYGVVDAYAALQTIMSSSDPGTIESQVVVNDMYFNLGNYTEILSVTDALLPGNFSYVWQVYKSDGLWHDIAPTNSASFAYRDSYYQRETKFRRKVVTSSGAGMVSNECTVINYAYHDIIPHYLGTYSSDFTCSALTYTHAPYYSNINYPYPAFERTGGIVYFTLTLETEMECDLIITSPEIPYLFMVGESIVDDMGDIMWDNLFMGNVFPNWTDYETPFTDFENGTVTLTLNVPAGEFYFWTQGCSGGNAGSGANGFYHLIINGRVPE